MGAVGVFRVRFFLFASAILGGQFVWAQEKPVTFKHVAAPASRLIRDLAYQTGIALRVAPEVADSILVVEVTNVPFVDLLHKIGDTLDATWADTATGKLLYRTGAKNHELHQRDLAGRLMLAEAVIAKERALARSFQPFDSASAKTLASQIIAEEQDAQLRRTGQGLARDLERRTPAGRLLARLAGGLTPDDLAEITLGESAVFTLDPNPVQKPLGMQASQMRDLYLTEHNALALELNSPSNAQDPIKQPYASAPALVLLRVKREVEGGFGLRLTLGDASGRLLESSSDAVEVAETPAKEIPEPMAGLKEAYVKFDPLSQVFLVQMRAMSLSSKAATNGPDDESLKKFLEDPVARDPLELVVTDTLLSIAESEHRDLVANPHDELLFHLSLPSVSGKLSLRNALGILALRGDLDIQRDGKWLLIRQSKPLECAKRQTDRSALAKFLRSLEKNHRIALDDLAEYTARMNIDLSDSFTSVLYLMMLAPRMIAGLGDYGGSDMLRLYGKLDEDQRATLLRGQPLVFRALTSEQKDQIRRMVYDSYPESDDPKTIRSQQIKDPTLVAPQGIPGDSKLLARAADEPVVYASASKGSPQSWPQAETARQLGQALAQRERPDQFGGAVRAPLDQFWAGTLRKIEFKFQYAADFYLPRTLHDAIFDANTIPVAYKDLPEAFRRDVEGFTAEYRKTISESAKNKRPLTAIPP